VNRRVGTWVFGPVQGFHHWADDSVQTGGEETAEAVLAEIRRLRQRIVQLSGSLVATCEKHIVGHLLVCGRHRNLLLWP
jgi:hypothetical protein